MLRVVLAILCLSLLPKPVLAWGAQGHEIVALVALDNLTPSARRQVARLLGSDTMLVHDASWADEIRDARPETGPWHYVDIPLAAPGYVNARDCRGGHCVVAQIGVMQARLANTRLPKAVRAEALRFLVHFVGDVHQPLHAEEDDRGGNGVRVILRGERSNLHRVWDADVVQALGRDSNRIAFDIAANLTPVQRRATQTGNAMAWANESQRLARNIYAIVDARRLLRLAPDYPRQQAAVTRLQLARAGLRLAMVLNASLN